MSAPNPIATLQQNASDFFNKVAEKNATKMECKKGCSQCCMTDISVFDIEADRIRDFVREQSLDQEKKMHLKELWEKNSCSRGLSFFSRQPMYNL